MIGVQYGNIQTDLASPSLTAFEGRSLRYRVAAITANVISKIATSTFGGAESTRSHKLESIHKYELVSFDAGEWKSSSML